MRRLLLFLCIVLAGCSKHHDPGFTSVTGKWTYTTPDNKIAVTFELTKQVSGDVTIGNPTFKIDGTAYQSAAQISGVSLPAIQKIRLNTNDPGLSLDYNIEFDNGAISTDFKVINVPSASYSWTSGVPVTLTAIKITRL